MIITYRCYSFHMQVGGFIADRFALIFSTVWAFSKRSESNDKLPNVLISKNNTNNQHNRELITTSYI